MRIGTAAFLWLPLRRVPWCSSWGANTTIVPEKTMPSRFLCASAARSGIVRVMQSGTQETIEASEAPSNVSYAGKWAALVRYYHVARCGIYTCTCKSLLPTLPCNCDDTHFSVPACRPLCLQGLLSLRLCLAARKDGVLLPPSLLTKVQPPPRRQC